MRNMKFVKRIGVAVLAACMVLSCVGCGSSSNKGAAEGTTEIAAEVRRRVEETIQEYGGWD